MSDDMQKNQEVTKHKPVEEEHLINVAELLGNKDLAIAGLTIRLEKANEKIKTLEKALERALEIKKKGRK